MPGTILPDARDRARLWQAVLGVLQLDLNPSSYSAWLEGTRPAAIADGCLLVETPRALHLEWLNARFAPSVRRALASVSGEPLDVRFIARQQDGDADRAAEQPRPGSHCAAPLANLTIGRVDQRLALDCYFTADANRLAYDACLALLDAPDVALSPVAIWGAPGLGKTHLLHGLARRALAAGWSTACLSAEAFTTGYQVALRARDATAFKSSVRDVRLLIVDDLQYLTGKRGTQDELANTIDDVTHAGGHVVVAGELHPLALELSGRLATRLGAGVIARIGAFDATERRAFVEALLRDLRASLPPWAIDRMAASGALSLRLLRGAVATALTSQRCGLLDPARLDTDLARIELTDIAGTARQPADILDAVATHFGTTPDALAGRSRSASIASARAVAAAALKDRGHSLAEIAALLGGRDRTTLSPVVRRGRLLLENDPTLRARLAG